MHIHDTIKGILVMKLISIYEKNSLNNCINCVQLFLSSNVSSMNGINDYCSKIQIWSNVTSLTKLCQFLHLFNIQSTVENSIKIWRATWTNSKSNSLRVQINRDLETQLLTLFCLHFYFLLVSWLYMLHIYNWIKKKTQNT